MPSAIIGHTGFVGSNLIRQNQFNEFFNSKNIEAIIGKGYDFLVCSGAPAEKWKANKEPIKDFENLKRLRECLNKVEVGKFVLISTVDVYPLPKEIDEDSAADFADASPYGRHRWELEKFVQNRFDSIVIRLPGLFGDGLKKNVIYDFMNNNCLDQIHADSIYQFYFLDHLWKDIQILLHHNIPLINFATEPVGVQEICSKVFRIEFKNRPHDKPSYYDFRTKYDHLFSGVRGYLYSKEQVLTDLKAFVSRCSGPGK